MKKLVIIGVGLIGSSLALGLKTRKSAYEVIGVFRSKSNANLALEMGVVDRCVSDLGEVAAELGGGDIVMMTVPTLSIEAVLHQCRSLLSPSVTITDGASVKGSVREAALAVYGCIPSQLVLGHPIAGSEKSGVSAANPNLYVNHRVILTPMPETDHAHVDDVAKMWREVGAEILLMDVDLHDEILGATSHLPHVIAYSLVDTLASDAHNEDIFRYAAGGFRDFTRIASSDPDMWHDIMLANKKSVLHSIDLFTANLERLRAAIESNDGDAIKGVFTRAKTARDHFTQRLKQQEK
ncbi:prephenate dehydrogenase/arogenate dehydrogenase family protein [Marinibactrum halimedae]|uniref:prephenate dehydrogenase n=1 Tax=Marinibactrum halimedae TaxID=1444977 RepID=A0AA37T710_9GAMM|nr:prephenate dehydrogenase/arogenate dehydrogenase family protein [Marinibactrum halimedae]MCD9459821.1 prephenate dehydrogenase/arogenate dehydrogenase family protein [Marinibactrum halimedae]GLS26986.1 hypothetical protein GCM10007877_27050 [Marinibactrum halimedae]